MRQILAGLLAISLGCLPACQKADPASVDAPAPATPASSKPVSTPAPPASAIDAAVKPNFPVLEIATFDGKKFSLAEHRGKWVVVNFWATWCNPCLKEIPDLEAFDKSRADVDVIGLAYEEIERADMQAFLRSHPISYPIAVLDVYKPPADFDIPRGLPMTYLIAPDGKVARQFLGPIGSADLAAAISAYSKASPAAT